LNIPEAYRSKWELSLPGPWSDAYGAHLTFVASEDFRQTATVGPSLPFDLSKDSLRRTALDARKAFVSTLDDGHKALLEQKLAEHLTSLCAHSSVVAGYAPMGSEISPMLAMEEARAVGRIVAFPAFSDPAKPFRFLAGDPAEPGPFGFLQPKRRAPTVEPDLIFVPLIAVDAKGTRLGRGKSGIKVFDRRALDEYVRCFNAHSTCEDYRAAATIDLVHDRKDLKKKSRMPVLALWGRQGVIAALFNCLEDWREVATDVRGRALQCGHFIPEEKPKELLAELRRFLR